MFFGDSFFKKQIADIWNFQWIKYLDKGLSCLKNWGIWVKHYWNYGPSKFLLQFIEYRLDQLNNKHTKITVNSAIQHFEGCSQNKCLLKVWSSLSTHHKKVCKVFAKLNGNHLLMANIFKLHEYPAFGLMKMRNMCKIWLANKIFSLWKGWFTINGPSKMLFFTFWLFPLPKILKTMSKML